MNDKFASLKKYKNDSPVDAAALSESLDKSSETVDRMVTKIPADLYNALVKNNLPFTFFARMAIMEKAKREGYI